MEWRYGNDTLYHWGIKGMKWGVRRYQNPDGTLTPAGRKRYYNADGGLTPEGRKRVYNADGWRSIEGMRDYVNDHFDEYRRKLAESGRAGTIVHDPEDLNIIEKERKHGMKENNRRTALKRLGAAAVTLGGGVVMGSLFGQSGIASAVVTGSMLMSMIEQGRIETNEMVNRYAETRIDQLGLIAIQEEEWVDEEDK